MSDYTPRAGSLAALVIAYLTQHGGTLRSPQIAELFNVPPKNVSASLALAVKGGQLVACKVTRGDGLGSPEMNEYRLSAGGKPAAWRDFSVSKTPPHRKVAAYEAPSAPPPRPNAADRMAADFDARDVLTTASALEQRGKAGEDCAPAADKPGESAPNIPGSVPVELASALTSAQASAAGNATPPPPAPDAAPTAEGAGQGAFGAPYFAMDSDACLTIVMNDRHIELQQPHAARLFKFLNRFGDVL